jgi:FMN phosphatase YigB (HAD superfamily)
MTAIIFDVDDTLVQSSHFDGILYKRAVKEVLGDVIIRDDWNEYKDVTDGGILSQIIKENGINDMCLFDKVRYRFGVLTVSYLAAGGECRPTSGAVDFIRELNESEIYHVGFATGGWGHTANLKLLSAGFCLDDMPLISSDYSFERTSIMRECLSRLGNGFEKSVYFGDSLWDVGACNNLGWNFIGVGLKLKGKCRRWIKDFSNLKEVFKMIYFSRTE